MGQTAPASQPNRSAGRYPDGADSDFNCRDFQLQNAISLLAPAAAGSKNIKVGSVANFVNGQKIIIGSGRNSETAVIAIVGTTGGTTVGTATKAGITVIPVVSMEGFNAGQSITIDGGANLETAVVASTSAGRRRMGPGAGGGSMPMDSIKVTMPLKFAHAVGAQVSGSGITLTSPLTKAHENGEQLSSNLPTPGEPNQYVRRP